MPPFNAPPDEMEFGQKKKRSVEEIAAGVTNVLLMLIVAFFTCASLWLGVFAIPSFFAFFRASVVTISSIREGINQLQGSIEPGPPLAFRSLRFGAACGLILTFIAGGLTIFALELVRFWFVDGDEDAENAFNGIFRILGAVIFTHLGVSVLQQGSRMVRSASYYQAKIHDFKLRPETAAGPDRTQMFHLGLKASLLEGVESYLYMFPLGGAYATKYLPLPAVLGAIAGLLAARYIAPALVWGAIVGESEGIHPDSNAKSWALRREALTDQYVARLAAHAKGRAGLSGNGEPKLPRDALYASGASGFGEDADAVVKNLSQLNAGALREMFKDSNVDLENFDDMDYAQKRLMILKSSKALFAKDSDDGANDSDADEEVPGILSLQHSEQWASVSCRSMEEKVEEGKQDASRPPLFPPNPAGSGQRAIFHRKGPSLVSIAEDADGYLDRGGYSDDGRSNFVVREISDAASVHHARARSDGLPPQPLRSAMRAGGSGGQVGSGGIAAGRSRQHSMASSVRFLDDSFEDVDDDTRSVMSGFEHRYITQAGSRNPSTELEVMEKTLSQMTRRTRSRERTSSFRPMSPMHQAPMAPKSAEDLDASVGGNLALGSDPSSSRGILSMLSRASSRKRTASAELMGVVDEEETAVDEEMGDVGFTGRNAVPDDATDVSFFATIALALSSFIIFGCCAGLLKLGVLDIKDFYSDTDNVVFDICDVSSTCCSPDEQGSVAEMFFAIFNTQFGYTCRETYVGLIAWAVYWIYPTIVLQFVMRVACFSSIPLKAQPQMRSVPVRRAGGGQAAAAYSARSSIKRILAGDVPDPARIKMHPTHFWIKLSALINVVAGIAYIWWRAARSMPDDAKSPLWNWLFFTGECILTVGVWTSHLQRAFPSVRDVCDMDDLCEIDSNVANEALVCIMVPTAGEKMKNLKHVLLGAYSQRLWPTMMDTSRQLRVAVLDEKGRQEVLDLVEKVYKLAKVLTNPKVQLELSTKFNEPFVNPKIFMDYFNQMDALDKFVFAPECHPAFDIAVKLENYSGPRANLVRTSSSTGVRAKGKGKSKGPAGRLEEGFKKVFNTSPNIPSMIYSARASPGTPKVSPKAGNMNAAIFPNSPGEEPVIGDSARIVVVNDARHRLKTEFLQRTVPYFFKLNRRTGKNYDWADVGFVQTPQRFEDLGDGDPLGNHAILTFFVANISKDGVGGVTSCGQGSLWRVDALRGMAADGSQTVDHVQKPDVIGHKCGFRSEVLIEDTHTSLEFFKLQWRSAYVCEPGETLAVCVEQPNTVAWRVKQVFRWHIGAVQLLLKDGITFLCTSRMPTPLHKMFGLDSLTYYIQAVGGFFIILMPIMFSIFQETPFDTVDLEFVYFFFPYIITATIPTLLSIGWKNVNPNRVLTDEQFWLATCYVQVWAFALGVWNRLTCANPDNAWNLKCPVWPLGLLFCLLGVSAINTAVYWMFYLQFDIQGIWIFLASFGACIIVMYSIWPMVKLWWPGSIGLPSKYHAKFVLVLLFIALSCVLVVFIDVDT